MDRVVAACCAILVMPACVRRDVSSATTRVVSYNIYWDNPTDTANLWSLRRDGVIQVLNGLGPDLIGLQEAVRRADAPSSQVDDLIDGMPDHTAVALLTKEDPGYDVFDSLVLFRSSRYRLLSIDHFWLSTTPDVPYSDDFPRAPDAVAYGPRSVTCVLLDEQDGSGRVLFCNTHWDGVSSIVDGSARLVVDRLEGRYPDTPIILTGDFNAMPYLYDSWPTEPPWMPMVKNRGYGTLRELFEDGYGSVVPPEERVSSGCGWDECKDVQPLDARIDWVLNTPALFSEVCDDHDWVLERT